MNVNYNGRWIVTLALAYLALTSNFKPINIIVALLVATAVVFLVRPIPPATPPRRVRRTLIGSVVATVVALIRYLITLVEDLVVSGVQIARIVVTPSLPIRPGIIAIPAETETEPGLTLAAHSVTLTPGELVVEIGDDNILYTHCLDATRGEEHVKASLKVQRELLDDILP